MTAKRVHPKDIQIPFPYTVVAAWPRPTTGKNIPWRFGKEDSFRVQYDDALMEFWAFGRGPIGYWFRADEAEGEYTVEVPIPDNKMIFRFTDEDTAFRFKMRFV